ncbi:NAD+ synthase [Candidatus Profftia sp. (ex Adelges kitamiensis)]|uniref:NAD+ synthase n=1 Tax=Candidatus Profftia sp. (ex Adelges kitamiensis) TaxID=2864218 RepID=UPI001CE2F2D9|nr:NAD+ synthase [Candidatus Profftia sp. (ex Adelges kitamiensis)]
MDRSLSIALAQLNWLVGDIEGNTKRMITTLQEQRNIGADLVMFSELALSGYPPEDLLYRKDFYLRCYQQLNYLQQASIGIAIIVGHPWRQDNVLYNALSMFSEGKVIARYFKQKLPNYGVFDEKRYFSVGKDTCIVKFKDYYLGLLICEDLWFYDPVNNAATAGAEILLSIHASPYHRKKPYIRRELLINQCKCTGLPLVYLNQVGGQDELIFDGGSKGLDASGNVTHSLASFTEHTVLFNLHNMQVKPMITPISYQSEIAQIYEALVLAVRDYVIKNGFEGVLLGLSGGIDSALTLAIAVDALGRDKVLAIMMPFLYTTSISIAYAKEEAKILGVDFKIVSIQPIFEACMSQVMPIFNGNKKNNTEENLQARCRGLLLMAISNNLHRIVLTTNNKSEMAVGYTTLYGDMVGGFAVLKDVTKTLVFQLSKYRNTISYVIPIGVIERSPSAELAPNQIDQDSLPPYNILDAILEGYIEQDQSIEDLITAGFTEEVVRKIIRLVDINEYKRRQSAIGPRITTRNFGKDRRYPITSFFNHKNLQKN